MAKRPHKFWNYVIPDGSTTNGNDFLQWQCFGTMSFQMVLLQLFLDDLQKHSFGTMSFQMVLLQKGLATVYAGSFGTMSFQMVLLRHAGKGGAMESFGTMSFQMVLLPLLKAVLKDAVLELCHSRWFYY